MSHLWQRYLNFMHKRLKSKDDIVCEQKNVCDCWKKIELARLWEAELLMKSLTGRVGQGEDTNHRVHFQLWKLLQNGDKTDVDNYRVIQKIAQICRDQNWQKKYLQESFIESSAHSMSLGTMTRREHRAYFFSILIMSHILWCFKYWNEVGSITL